MRFKENLMLYYSLITLAVTVVVTVVTGIWIGEQNRKHLINTHLELYPLLIEHMFHDNEEAVKYFGEDSEKPVPGRISEHLDLVFELNPVVEINLWNPEGKLLWSESSDTSHGALLSDPPPKGGEPGSITYFQETVQDQVFFRSLIPVLFDGAVIGTVEIIENNIKLEDRIRKMVFISRIITISAGTVLYLLLFYLFFRAYAHQKKITEQVKKTEDITIYALAYQAGLRDEETGAHLKRASEYVRILAEELGRIKSFRKYISRSYIEDLVKSAPLHDIGKVGIEDSILRKPGKLTPEEYERIKEHCELGAEILESAIHDITFMSFLDIAIQLIRHHHERWDGKGYPDGLAGVNIPLSARIMALSDVYDALRSDRHYKKAFSHQESLRIIREGSGTQFDPEVVDAFLKNEAEFLAVSERLKD